MNRGDLAIAVATAVDPTALMQRVCDRTLELIAAAEGSAVSVVDGPRVTYLCGAGTSRDVGGTVVPLDGSLSGMAIKFGQVLHARGARQDWRVDADACAKLNVVSLVCVPLVRAGVRFGVLAVNSPRPEAFSNNDVAVLTRLADFVGVAVGSAVDLHRASRALVELDPSDSDTDRYVMSVIDPERVAMLEARDRISDFLENPQLIEVVFQPIVDLVSGRTVSVEALARFASPSHRPPNEWFEEAHRVGLGVALEQVAVARALEYEPMIPDGVSISVNVGPEAIITPHLRQLISRFGRGRVVIELTEHAAFERFPEMPAALVPLRRAGALISVDDAGSGYSTLAHILRLAPDFIKLDRQLISGIDLDPVRRAMVTSMVTFAGETGATILAEGIENADELETVRSLGVRFCQGFHLSRPAPLEQLDLSSPIDCAPALDRPTARS